MELKRATVASSKTATRYYSSNGAIIGSRTGPDGSAERRILADTEGLRRRAREYDPQLGRFISVDPLMDMVDPQQWNGYSYSNNTPVTMSGHDCHRGVSEGEGMFGSCG
ncbi:RHS repeat-associated core domain-containing protein [Nucisporomicrobium flavum]|uniref:RHS repeat-associated core domain-containing protein n=1 Tax=Nucisporomicrobium flavum TaxID=2785915 RepID=UPI003C2CB44B